MFRSLQCHYPLARRFTTKVRTPSTSKFLADKHVLESSQFNRSQLEELLNVAQFIKREVQEHGGVDLLTGRVASFFFSETSHRTTGSFHAAMIRAGGRVLPVITQFSSPDEAFEDVIRTIQGLSDVIVMHHPETSYLARVAAVAEVPIINCDGGEDHVTQGLLDLMCIQSSVGKIDGLTIAMIGDLKHDLASRSLSQLLSNFNVNLEFVSPKDLEVPDAVTKVLKAKKVPYNISTQLSSVLHKADVIHLAQANPDHFKNEAEFEKFKNSYVVNQAMLDSCKPSLRLLHPYPKQTETDLDIDRDPRVMYFKQPLYGMYIRMTLLAAVLGVL